MHSRYKILALKLKKADFPSDKVFDQIRHLPKIGWGTIWYGRRWPKNDKSWTDPNLKLIFTSMKQVINSGIQMIDTAAAYGYCEQRLGNFFKLHPSYADRVFIATKWRAEHDPNKEHRGL